MSLCCMGKLTSYLAPLKENMPLKELQVYEAEKHHCMHCDPVRKSMCDLQIYD